MRLAAMSRIFHMVILIAALVGTGAHPVLVWGDGNVIPQDYVLEKCRSNDIVFLGTTHRQSAILAMIADLLPNLTRAGVTHLGLEIGSDQQDLIDAYLLGDGDPSRIALSDAIECPQYRHLFQVLHDLPKPHRPVVVALDLPVTLYGQGMERNRWMAMKLASIVRSRNDAKILAVMGSLHVLNRLEWLPEVRDPMPSIRTRLSQNQPAFAMFSIVNIIGSPDTACDFARRMGSLSSDLALDVDQRFKGWELGLTRYAAIAPAEPWTLFDGIIIHVETPDS